MESGQWIEAKWQGARVAWRRGTAVFDLNLHSTVEPILAVAYFAVYEADLVRVEQQTDELTSVAEQNTSLTHQLTKTDLARSLEINSATRQAHAARLQLLRLRSVLGEFPSEFTVASRQLVQQLSIKAEVEERIEELEHRLEVVAEFFDVANDRLTEFSYFWREYKLEWWILVMLALEVLLLVIEALVIWRGL
jgi:hypothetical protein